MFDHAAHQLKSKRRAAENKWLRNKTQENKEKYQQINKAYKTYLQNNKKEHIKAKLSNPNTNNIRAFYKTIKRLVDNQEKKTNCQTQIIAYRMNSLSSSWTELKRFTHSMITHTSMTPHQKFHTSQGIS